MIPAFWSELPEIIDEMSDWSGALCRHLLDRQALQRRHGPVGVHRRRRVDRRLDGASGGDSNEVGRQRANLRTNAMHLQRSFSALEEARMPVPVRSRWCVGGAVDMVTAADRRYATEDAWFCIQEINIGMTADVGTLQRLEADSDGVVRELAYTGDRMSAQRAKEVGLVNEVYPDHETMVNDVLDIAGRIAAKSPLAIYGTKQSVLYARDHTVADSLNQISLWQTGMFQPDDMMESFPLNGKASRFETSTWCGGAGLVLGEGDIAHAHKRGCDPTAERTEVVVEELPSASRSSSSSYEPS